MYFVMVIGLMVVAPLASIAVELAVAQGNADLLFVVGKWFLFWGAGVRLFVAGVSQVIRPQFTAQNILGETTAAANLVVQELGFANLGIGAASIAGAWVSGWAVPVAIVPAIFLTAAGLRHIAKKGKNSKELLALATDLLVGLVLVVFVVGMLVR